MSDEKVENPSQVEKAQAVGFDMDAQIALAAHEQHGIDVHIHGVDEQPLFFVNEKGEVEPVTINVSGAHSPQYRRVEQMLRKRKLKPSKMTGQAVYEDTIEKIAAVTNSWRGFHVGGKFIDCTPHNIKELYKRCEWVLDQVAEAVHDHKRFFENGSMPPSST